jgi:hypothetical protein
MTHLTAAWNTVGWLRTRPLRRVGFTPKVPYSSSGSGSLRIDWMRAVKSLQWQQQQQQKEKKQG